MSDTDAASPDGDVGGPPGKASDPGPDADGSPGRGAFGGLWGKTSVRITAGVVAAVVAAGIAWGAVTALHGSPVSADARIPSPPAKNDVFVKDHYGAGQDQQDNVLQYTAPGMIILKSASGANLGAGLVITKSGYALASYHSLSTAGALTARLVMSDKTYSARVVGSDPEANLALLQLPGTGFSPVAIGTSSDISLADRVGSGGGTWASTGLTMSTGAITGIGVPVKLDGNHLTGLIKVSSLGAPANELGGPLLNLSGQVIGVDVAWGSGGGFAVPIDDALRVARQILGQ